MNYKGYFSDLYCKKYEVRITSSGDNSAYQEILLAGDQPFTVRYNESQTPFDPVRTSTATINIVHDDYLHDALSHCAQGTIVELLDITNSATPVTKCETTALLLAHPKPHLLMQNSSQGI